LSVDELLAELNRFWNASKDPHYKGEHPECEVIQRELLKAFSDLDDEELAALLKT